MSFNDFGFSKEILRALVDKDYQKPTPVQELAIPIVMKGHDLLVSAQTGTGKTAGFTLPLLHLLSLKPKIQGSRSIRALILTPTRELAAQIEESVRAYGKYLPFKSTIVFGGVSISTQIRILRNGVDILVATPGRLIDLVTQRAVDLSKIEILVLDEADRMLDMGFIRDIRKILTYVPKTRQTLLFCATFSEEIKRLAESFLTSPQLIEVSRRNSTKTSITQVVHPVDHCRKRELLISLIQTKNWNQVLVFTRTKHGAHRLSNQLNDEGIRSTSIHGNKTQAARTKALFDFKQGAVRVLVATDIAARGIDIEELPHVVNFDLPSAAEDYVHRIGRTGRANNVGEAISLVSSEENDLLKKIERLLQSSISKVIIDGFEPKSSSNRAPKNNRSFHRRYNSDKGRPKSYR